MKILILVKQKILENFFTREYKAAISKDISKAYIDIDDLKIFKDFYTNDKIMNKTKGKNKPTTKTKTKNKDTLDAINNKIDMINTLYNGIKKVKAKVTKKIELIYESMCELPDEIYSDDSWLGLVKLEKIDAIIDQSLNIVWNMVCRENRISTEEIKIDKHKEIEGYVSELTDVLNNKIELVNRKLE